MRFQHTVCGGEIDTKTRQCTKCKHKWSWFSFMFTPTDIRVMREAPGVNPKPGKFDWMTPENVVKHLPKWPRWARILSVGVVLVLVIVLVMWLRSL